MAAVNPFFGVCGYKVISEQMHSRLPRVQAIVEVRVGIDCVSRSATGVGPVHALDSALRACLLPHFPDLGETRLSDYKVSVVDATDGTGAEVRVYVEMTDGRTSWSEACISANIIEASFDALCATAVMAIGARTGIGARRDSAVPA